MTEKGYMYQIVTEFLAIPNNIEFHFRTIE